MIKWVLWHNFVSSEPVLETTWRKVADRAKLVNIVSDLKFNEDYVLLFGEYLIDRNEEPRHKSPTWAVIFATCLVWNGSVV